MVGVSLFGGNPEIYGNCIPRLPSRWASSLAACGATCANAGTSLELQMCFPLLVACVAVENAVAFQSNECDNADSIQC